MRHAEYYKATTELRSLLVHFDFSRFKLHAVIVETLAFVAAVANITDFKVSKNYFDKT
jgi:hypothetical protein